MVAQVRGHVLLKLTVLAVTFIRTACLPLATSDNPRTTLSSPGVDLLPRPSSVLPATMTSNKMVPQAWSTTTTRSLPGNDISSGGGTGPKQGNNVDVWSSTRKTPSVPPVPTVQPVPHDGKDDATADNDDDDRWCPSYCSSDGNKYGRQKCTMPRSFCCRTNDSGFRLVCCTNKSDEWTNDKDDYDCGFRYWSTVFGVCVPVGSVCFIVVIILIAYQQRQRLRHQFVKIRKYFGFHVREETTTVSAANRSSSVDSTAMGSRHNDDPQTTPSGQTQSDQSAAATDQRRGDVRGSRTAVYNAAFNPNDDDDGATAPPNYYDIYFIPDPERTDLRSPVEVLDRFPMDGTSAASISASSSVAIGITQLPPPYDFGQSSSRPPDYTMLFPVPVNPSV